MAQMYTKPIRAEIQWVFLCARYNFLDRHHNFIHNWARFEEEIHTLSQFTNTIVMTKLQNSKHTLNE